ncbi:MAG: hypothetical protein HFH31_00580 [Bacilli bacterium]|nr:hypothetical protein [Bacilli bacterium]
MFNGNGITLLAYEEYLCKDLDVSNDDLKNLQEIFGYCDKNYGNNYPSFVNEVLQNPKHIIMNMFSDLEKGSYKFSFCVGQVSDNSTTIETIIYNPHSGDIEKEFCYEFTNRFLGLNDNNQLDLIFKTCEETQKY